MTNGLYPQYITEKKSIKHIWINISEVGSYKKLFYQLGNLASLTGDSKMVRDSVHHVLAMPRSYVVAIKTYYEPKNAAS